jgi:hypothetical protein
MKSGSIAAALAACVALAAPPAMAQPYPASRRRAGAVQAGRSYRLSVRAIADEVEKLVENSDAKAF